MCGFIAQLVEQRTGNYFIYFTIKELFKEEVGYDLLKCFLSGMQTKFYHDTFLKLVFTYNTIKTFLLALAIT